MRESIFGILSLWLFFMVACTGDQAFGVEDGLRDIISDVAPTGDLSYYIFPPSHKYENLPHQDPKNPVTQEKVKLGNLLFFETGLAQNADNLNSMESYSCASCHTPEAGFLPMTVQGIGDGGWGFGEQGEFRVVAPSYTEYSIDVQGTRPMNPLNSGYSKVALWSGMFGSTGPNEGTEANWLGTAAINHEGYEGLEAQNIESMHIHRLAVNARVLDTFGYRTLFDEAFADVDIEDRYNATTAGLAISAFLRTFTANMAPFQSWLKGDDDAMTASQKRGASLFFGKANCTSCHKETAFNAMEFHVLGVADLYEVGGLNTDADDPRNLGRAMLTGLEQDKYAFKVPQLYNLKDYSHFFHGSSKSSIEEVIDYKLKAKSENPQVADEKLSSYFNERQLTPTEISYLVDFLENALYDPNLNRYVPDATLSGNCFPNNDPMSQAQTGCE